MNQEGHRIRSRRRRSRSTSRTPNPKDSQDGSLETESSISRSQSVEKGQQVTLQVKLQSNSQSSVSSRDSSRRKLKLRKSSRRKDRSRSRGDKSRSRSRGQKSRSRSRGRRSRSRSRSRSRGTSKGFSRSPVVVRGRSWRYRDEGKVKRTRVSRSSRDRSRSRSRHRRHHHHHGRKRSPTRTLSRRDKHRARKRSRSRSRRHVSKVKICRSRSRSQSHSSSHKTKSRHASSSSSSSSSEAGGLVSPPKTKRKSTSPPRCTSAFTKTRIVAAINVSFEATKDQLKALFGFCGRVKDIAVFPPIHFMHFGVRGLPYKVCLVKYAKCSSSKIALHLTGTVFLDKTLMVVPCELEEIPDDEQIAWDAVCAGVKTLVMRPTSEDETVVCEESDKEENGPQTAVTTPDIKNTEGHHDQIDGQSQDTPIPAENTQTGSCLVENDEMVFDVEAEGTLLKNIDFELADADVDIIGKEMGEEEQS